jgi:hypothetical protein
MHVRQLQEDCLIVDTVQAGLGMIAIGLGLGVWCEVASVPPWALQHTAAVTQQDSTASGHQAVVTQSYA